MIKLVEICDLFQMEPGAPNPLVLSGSNKMEILFNALDGEVDLNNNFLVEKNNSSVISIKFQRCIAYKIGCPSNETIFGHPYYRLELESYAFFEVLNSDYIEEVKNINKVHPRFDPLQWRDYKHYLLTFHDEMFECIAECYEVKFENAVRYKTLLQIIDPTA